MLEQLILGIVQGITEWLPISSEGILTLIRVKLFNKPISLEEAIRVALFLHMGTFFSALVYFRREVWRLTRSLFMFKHADPETKAVLRFLIGGTIVTGIIASIILWGISVAEREFAFTGNSIMLLVGIALLFTAFIQFVSKKKGLRGKDNINAKDWIFTGIAQGFSVLPGISRSGMTTSALLLSRVNEVLSLRLSFLMSLPVVLAGNIILNFSEFKFTLPVFVALGSSFLFGLLTIHALLKLAQKINFAYFVLFFGLLAISAAFI